MTGDRYAGLTRAELEARLALAEDVCALAGWTPMRDDTDREKALHELWVRWSDATPNGPGDFPHLTDELVAELAARRNAVRAATHARLGLNVPGDADPVWERCTGPCGREYAYPHLCREHMLCGLCHPPVHPEEPDAPR